MSRRLSLDGLFGRRRRMSDSEIQTEPEFDIDSILENGKIKSKAWKRLVPDQRKYVLDLIDDEEYSDDVLGEIHVANRVYILSDNYSALQAEWRISTRTHSRSSIEVTRNALNDEAAMSGIVERVATMITERISVKTPPRENRSWDEWEDWGPYFSGWEGYRIIQEEPFYEDENYQVFEDMDTDHKHYFRRFMIQTEDASAHGYFEALAHIFNSNVKMKNAMSHGYIGVSFETQDDEGNDKFYRFDSDMGIDRMIYEFYRVLEDECEGSDTYIFIRHHIIRMNITITRIPSGGSEGSDLLSIFKRFVIRKNKDRNDNTCFYRCVRKIISGDSGVLYRKPTVDMRSIISSVSRLDFNTFMFPVDKLHAVCKAFNVELVVFENTIPEIIIRNSSIKFNSYKNIQQNIILKWKVFYPEEGYIYSDRITERCTTTDYSYIKYDCGNVVLKHFKRYLMIFHNNHYDLIREFRDPIYCIKCGSKEHTADDATRDQGVKVQCLLKLHGILDDHAIKVEMPKYKLVFFDFETFVKNSYQQPYMVSFIITDSSYEIIEKQTFVGFQCDLRFTRYITEVYKELKYLIGFNSASFDNYFIMRSLIKLFDHSLLSSESSNIYKKRILKLNAKNIVTWDLNEFTKTSLRKACEAYHIDGQKGDLNYRHITELFNLHKKKTFDHPDFIKLNADDYCMNDVEITMKLFIKIHDELQNLSGLLPLNYSTLPGLIYKEFNLQFEKIPFRYNDIFDSILGGRIQAFETGTFDDQEYSLIDLNSSYPYICITNEFGTGRMVERRPKPGELYMCLCDVDQTSLKIKLIGYKNEKGKNVWTANKLENVWLQPEELITLKFYKCPIIKKKYLTWEKKEFVLKDKMSRIKDERMAAKNQKNIVKEMMSKLRGNGLTGKTIEKNHDETWKIVKSKSEYVNFAKKYTNTTKINPLMRNIYMLEGRNPPSEYIKRPRHIGARIYALNRLHLWNFAIRFNRILYCAVDSLIVPSNELHKIQEYINEKEYGFMKIEHVSKKVYVIGPHNYRMNDKKMSLRNYRDGDLWETSNGLKGSTKTENLYKALLDPTVDVTTTYTRITKRFSMEQDGKYHLNCLYTSETSKILG